MIQLKTLGTCDLSAPDRPDAAEVLTQPKRFALLVYLAAAQPRGFVRRDTLLALFWPENDQAHGRRALRQTVYLLRQSLGADAILSRGDDEVAVSTEQVGCDVGLFEDALAQERTADALECYRGDFLSGLHVPDASQELEEWIEGERRRLRALATGAAWTLAQREEQGGNGAGASHWARRAVALNPDDEPGVRDLMGLLARVGDRSGALRAYAEYARRLTDELGVEPGPEVARLAESLRGATAASPAATPVVPSATVAPAPAAPVAASVGATAMPRRLGVIAGAILALAVAVVATTSLLTRGSSTTPVIAVGPIADALAGGATSNVPADLLSTSLARLVGVHVIPVTRLYDLEAQLRAAGRPGTSVIEAAREAGAGELIQGTLHRAAPDRLQLDLQVINIASGAVQHAYRAEGADLFAVVDDATSRIAAGFGVPSPAGRITDVTTHSIVAYRLYDEGLRAYYEDDLSGALRLFKAAVAEDSSFAMAAWYAGRAALLVSGGESGPLLLRAARLADRATDRERLLILEGVAELLMSPAANALADTLGIRYPLDPEAQFAVGHSLERRGDFLGAARQYRRVITMDSLSLGRRTSRCLACDAYGRLWWSYIYADSAVAAERIARSMEQARPGSNSALWLLGIALARQGREAEAYQVWARADSARVGAVNLELIAAGLAVRRGDFAQADEILRRLVRTRSAPTRREARWLLVISLRGQARIAEALAEARQQPSFSALGVTLIEAGRGLEAAALFERQLLPSDWPAPGHHARHHAWQLTHVATGLAAAGDTTRLAALADSVESHGARSGFGRDPRLHHYIRGLLFRARGDLTRAAEAFRASVWSWSDGYTRANYELARALLELGRPAAALYPLQAALRGDLESSNLYITRTELHELLAQAFEAAGQPDSAVAHYRAVASAWTDADRAFRTRWERARARTGSAPRPGA